MNNPSIADIVRPDEATFSDKDRDVLASFWHPVALESEVLDRPLSRRLLDVRLVVFRGEGGNQHRPFAVLPAQGNQRFQAILRSFGNRAHPALPA